MYLHLNHKKLDGYNAAENLVMEVYKLTDRFPSHEKYILSSQMRRASLSVLLNIAEGASRKTRIERRRFYEIVRSSVVELDTAMSVSARLSFVDPKTAEVVGQLIIRCYSMFSKMSGKTSERKRES